MPWSMIMAIPGHTRLLCIKLCCVFVLLIFSYNYYYGVAQCSSVDPEIFVRGVQLNSDNLFLVDVEWTKDPIPLKADHHRPVSKTPF